MLAPLSKTKKKNHDARTVMVKYSCKDQGPLRQVRVKDAQAATKGLGIYVFVVLPTRKRMRNQVSFNELSILVDNSDSADKLEANSQQVGKQIWQIKDKERLEMYKKRQYNN
mmetsp:Transcript_55246/g.75505  ORF Transcript_55246/g.75505 Transcript_55246/m.75505 type:complete len:112 (+) Transcript_55246:104-439(+)